MAWYIDLGANWANTLGLFEHVKLQTRWNIVAFEASPLVQPFNDQWRKIKGSLTEKIRIFLQDSLTYYFKPTVSRRDGLCHKVSLACFSHIPILLETQTRIPWVQRCAELCLHLQIAFPGVEFRIVPILQQALKKLLRVATAQFTFFRAGIVTKRLRQRRKKIFFGISGMANLLHDILNLLKFSSGLNSHILSSSLLKAFIPSKIACP